MCTSKRGDPFRRERLVKLHIQTINDKNGCIKMYIQF